MKCPVCNSRKGKRSCPALGREICAQCCGEKRVTEIPCPADCAYLGPGLQNEWTRTFSGFFDWVETPDKAERYYRTLSSSFVLLRALEMELVRLTRRSSAFRDAEILETVGLALEDYRTEDKGILFSHSSPNPVVERLLRGFVDAIEKIREKAEKDMVRLSPAALADTLDLMHAQIRFLMSRPDDNERTYLDFTTRQCPPSYFEEEESDRDDPGRIVLAR